MKTIFVIIASLFYYSISFGQYQIDSLIKLPEKIDSDLQHLIYDYRIPEWGYQRLYVSFSATTYGYDRDYENEIQKSQRYSTQINPYYYKYKTSEKTTYSLRSILTSNYGYDKFKLDNESDVQKNEGYDVTIQYDLNGDLNKYLSNSLFLNLDAGTNYRYYESYDERTNEQDSIINKIKRSTIRRQYETNFSLGFGFGKVRNVNPVFKAIRFSERLKDLNKTPGLDAENAKKLASLYARQSSFSNTYDRSLKYFYEALPTNITDQISDLKPWEMMYLHEVSDEIIGDRYEGFMIDGGLSINHNRRIEDNNSINRNYNSELTLLGLYIEQRYYHNLTPGYQIGTNVYAAYSKALNENTETDFLGKGFIRLLNLWNLTDRMLLNFHIGYETSFASNEHVSVLSGGSEYISKDWERFDRFLAQVSLDYFLENNLSIYSTVSNDVSYDWPADTQNMVNSTSISNNNSEKYWRVRLGIRYYFIRGLL